MALPTKEHREKLKKEEFWLKYQKALYEAEARQQALNVNPKYLLVVKGG